MELLLLLILLAIRLTFCVLPSALDWWEERRPKSPAEKRQIAIKEAERGYLWGPPPPKEPDIRFRR